MELPKSVELVAKDGKAITLPIEVAKRSGLIKGLFEVVEGSNYQEPIPIPKVNIDILAKVFDWCTMYELYERDKDVKKKEKHDKQNQETDDQFTEEEFNQKYFQQLENEGSTALVFEIMMAANFLDVKPLLDVATSVIAKRIKACQTAESVQEAFDFKKTEPALKKKRKGLMNGIRRTIFQD
ncbi:hypothetical protein EDC01DRAFT_624185 [Geopyxis carbonaria]|nr:hypothetical protein EDC01DRAFT_624185 [Geopyxis carbonaria]